MRALIPTTLLSLIAIVFGHAQQAQTAFEVASVRPSDHEAGPDYNNKIVYSKGEFSARNATLRRLIAEAWQCQMRQVSGPAWLDRNEYDVTARLGGGAGEDQAPAMLRRLLAERFGLKAHEATRAMRVYVLAVGNSGARLKQGDSSKPGAGLPFHGTMRDFADLLAVQFSIPAPENPSTPVKAGGPSMPVLDRTNLPGVYDFNVDVRPEPGTDVFTAWKRVLEDQLGLRVESRQAEVPIVVVDEANKMPSEN